MHVLIITYHILRKYELIDTLYTEIEDKLHIISKCIDVHTKRDM